MPETTTNYGLKKPLPNEHYDIAVQNENMDTIDAVLAEKLDKAGAGSDVTVAFTQASSRTNVASGEKLSILFGKIRKWFADLKAVAFSGSYNDLTDKPAIPSALADLSEDSAHRTVTDAEKAAWNAKSTLTLGETATTAYRGDRGKIAYDHSQTTGNPHSTTPADIGAAAAIHTHGNISSDGRIGSTANHAIYTGTNGVLQAGTLPISAGGTGATSAASALSSLGAVPASRKVNGKALTSDISITAADIGVARSGVWKLLASYTTAGTFTWTAPDYYGDGQPYEVGVFIIGAGGSGAASSHYHQSGTNAYIGGSGGASGYTKILVTTVTPLAEYPVVVGAGGAAVSARNGTTEGNAGGASSFNGTTAMGGNGGTSWASSGTINGAVGGVNASPSANSISGSASILDRGTMAKFNPFDCMLYLGAGGGATAGTRGNGAQTGVDLPMGRSGGGKYIASSDVGGRAEDATSPGCGGGAIARSQASDLTSIPYVYSGAGADGAVFIYVRGLVE